MTFCDWLDRQAPSKNGPSGIGKENYTWSLQNVHLVPNVEMTAYDEAADGTTPGTDVVPRITLFFTW